MDHDLLQFYFVSFIFFFTCDQLSRVGSWETLMRYSSRIRVSALDLVRAPRRVFCVQGYGAGLVQYFLRRVWSGPP